MLHLQVHMFGKCHLRHHARSPQPEASSLKHSTCWGMHSDTPLLAGVQLLGLSAWKTLPGIGCQHVLG